MKLTLNCDACGQPVTEGYIHVDDEHARYVAQFIKDDDAERDRRYEEGDALAHMTSWDELSAHPRDAHWEIHHEGCDPAPDRGDYAFPVDEADTAAKLLGWSGHLHDKTWFQHTEWGKFVRRVLR